MPRQRRWLEAAHRYYYLFEYRPWSEADPVPEMTGTDLRLQGTRQDIDPNTGELRSNLLVDAEPATPVLVIGNADDPVTPIEDTEYLASTISASRLVTVDAGVHGSYATGNACADRVVEDYLVRAVAPRTAPSAFAARALV